MAKVKPSKRRINEGDNLTTVLSGFRKGAKLYYRIVGTNVSKSDFSTGRVSGIIRAGKSGTAKLKHKLKADKVTEGTESFRIEVFSDKKMRNLLGKSDSVTVFDTSIKAKKAPKATKMSGSKGGTDPVTGLELNLTSSSGSNPQTIKSDEQYNLTAWNQKLNNLGYPSILLDSGTFEYELGSNFIATTELHTLRTSKGIEARLTRLVYSGNFSYSKGKLAGATITSIATEGVSYDDGIITAKSGKIFSGRNPIKITNVKDPEQWLNAQKSFGNAKTSEYYTNLIYPEASIGSSQEISNLQNYGSGKFFYSNWESNPFDSNLL